MARIEVRSTIFASLHAVSSTLTQVTSMCSTISLPKVNYELTHAITLMSKILHLKILSKICQKQTM